jgi:ligand-binding sensor domain-containing protein/signal transduction histidine kinase
VIDTRLSRLALAAALLVWAAAAAPALDRDTPVSRLGHDVWQMRDGLPQNSVEAIAQTLDGYLWFGTEEGLARFDGVRFTVFGRDPSTGLLQNSIKALLAARDGSLWVGTNGGGLAQILRGRIVVYTRAQGLAGNAVSALTEDRDGGIWIGTNDGLARFDGTRFETFGEAQGLPLRPVRAMRVDRKGTLWVVTGRGAYRYVAGRFFLVPAIGPKLRAVAEAADGSMWFATQDRGAACLSPAGVRWYTRREGLPSDNVQTLIADEQGAIWFGTEGGGVARYAGGVFSAMDSRHGLSSNFLRAMFEDREGSLWLGTEGGGLNRLRQNRLAVIDNADGLATDFARAVFEDRDGARWVATDGGGLTRFDAGRVSRYSAAHGLPTGFVYAILQAADGRLWLGTNGSGVVAFDPRRAKVTGSVRGLHSDGVFSLAQDGKGRLWIGTSLGLSLARGLSAGRPAETAGCPALQTGHVGALHVDRQGLLWVGVRDHGLWTVGASGCRQVTDAGLADSSVNAIVEGRHGGLWVGTRQGLARRDAGGSWHRFTRADGLPGDTIYGIIEDSHSHLWLSSTSGLFRVSADSLDRRRHGERAPLEVEIFNTDDGMKVSETTGGGHPSSLRAGDGSLWFPTPRGVVVVNAVRSGGSPVVPPPILIEELTADDRAYDLGAAPALMPSSVGSIRVRYTALTFLAPTKTRFRYRLDGYHSDWVDAGKAREVTFRDLPPGTYTFRVIGATGDGVSNDTGASTSFTIEAPFYRSAWFAGVCVLGLAAAGYGAHRARVRAMRQRFSAVLAERSRLAREMHDTLLQGFAGVSLQLEVLRHRLSASGNGKEVVGQLDHVLSQVDTCLVDARRSVGDMRALALEQGDLVLAFRRMGGQIAQEAGVAVEVTVSGTPRRLPAPLETDLLRIGQEALTNAARYARASAIRIELRFERRHVRLVVHDDGQGFDAGQVDARAGSRFGLQGMRERAEHLGGRFALRTAPGTGTDIDVTVPVRG